MSISAQHRSLFIHTHNNLHTLTVKKSNNLHTQPHTTTRIYSSIATTTKRSKDHPNPNRITINEIPLSTPSLPQQQQPISKSIIDDPNLLSTWSHRAWVATGSITILTLLLKSATVSAETHSLLGPVLAGLLGYVLADFGSGVYHWGIDNYGDSSTPLFGSQIEAFQGHHKFPWTITKRQFSNNLHALARALTFFVLPIDLISNDPVFNAFAGVFAGCIMFSQQFHAWAHGTKSRLPPLVLALQDAGVIVSRIQHGAHHRSPFNNKYCIVSGAWNGFLDQQRVFEVLERVIFFKFGVRPRSWSDPGSEWTEETVGTPDLAEVSVSLDS